jgi:hypothetical protein
MGILKYHTTKVILPLQCSMGTELVFRSMPTEKLKLRENMVLKGTVPPGPEKAFVIVVRFLYEVGGKYGWFLYFFLSYEAMLMRPYYCGKNLVEASREDATRDGIV